MKQIWRILVYLAVTICVCSAIIVNDDDIQDVDQYQGNYYYGQSSDYDDYEDDYSKRRHKRRRRPCPSNKVAPNGKTLVNIYYSDVNVVESTHNYQGGSSYGCGPGILSPDVSNNNNNHQQLPQRPPSRPPFRPPHRPGLISNLINNRPGLLNNNNRPGNRPGLLQLLNNVLFGGDSKPYESPLTSSTSVEEESSLEDNIATGPLGGTVPDNVRVTAYNNYNNYNNIRRAYKEFNRELDSFLRPFYRLF